MTVREWSAVFGACLSWLHRSHFFPKDREPEEARADQQHSGRFGYVRRRGPLSIGGAVREIFKKDLRTAGQGFEREIYGRNRCVGGNSPERRRCGCACHHGEWRS